jgi:hypothetical protein
MAELKNISLESYQGKKRVTEITELELTQINEARKAIIEHGSPYSQALENGEYLHDKQSAWQVFDVDKTDLGISRVILWSERDDGSYSVHFKTDSTEPDFICYEN